MNVAGDLSKPRVTGDPTQVLALAVRWGATAELIWSAAESLRTLDAEGAQSDAIEAFLASAGEVEQQLRSVHGRYQGAGEALRAYAAALEEAQAASAPALREHGLAVDDHDAARRLVEKYEGMALVAVGEEARADYEELARVQRLRLAEAAERVVLHGGRVDAAHAAVEAAATTAIARLDDLEADGPRDSFWDDVSGAAGVAFDGFQQWMEDNDHWIDGLVTAAGIIGMVLAGVAMFIPGLNVLALALMVGILAVTSAQAVAGTGTWEDVAYAALSLATFGAGSALVSSAKTAAKGIGAARINSLVSSGQSRSFATATVKQAWDRSSAGVLHKSLRRELGNSEAAQIRRFLQRGRPGASTDDPGAIARTMDKLNGARFLSGSDVVVSGGRLAEPYVPGALAELRGAAR